MHSLPEAVPAFICMIAMPYLYSISEGIAFGIISFTILHLLCGRKEKKISWLMYALTIAFILKYILL